MHLLLVRHGETVDNVAHVLAGSRDSALTSHGVLQAKRLGTHLASRRDVIGTITHIFASNLQRAYKTAEAVVEAQLDSRPARNEPVPNIGVVRVAELREKDFGSSEGKKWDISKQNEGETMAGISDSETRDAMLVRVNRFIDTHLAPVLEENVAENAAILIVSHGIILNVLINALVTRFPAKELGGNLTAQSVVSTWSNTGILQAKVEALADNTGVGEKSATTTISQTTPDQRHSRRLAIMIHFANNVDHLSGLRKTRGGIGSSQFDSRQRTMDSFFVKTSKKRKSEDGMH